MENNKKNSLSSVEIIPLLLGALGLVMVFSAASGISVYQRSVPVSFIKQLGLFSIGLLLFFITSRLKPKFWKMINGKLILVAILLLILTYFFGRKINEARRWLYIGDISFQPSIFCQLAMVIFLAKKRDFILSVFVIGLTAGLILLQPDISTSLVTVLLGAVMLYLNGTDVRKILALSVILLLLGAGYGIKAEYPVERITTYLRPESISQTVKSISTGGLSGLGLGSGMGKFFYIPLADSDFIFSIIGEELGFTGSVSIIGIFFAYFITATRYSIRSSDEYLRVVGMGLIILISINALLHILVALGSLPVTGVPLPFISSGGTALIMYYISGGIIVSISKNSGNFGRRNWRSHLPGTDYG